MTVNLIRKLHSEFSFKPDAAINFCQIWRFFPVFVYLFYNNFITSRSIHSLILKGLWYSPNLIASNSVNFNKRLEVTRNIKLCSRLQFFFHECNLKEGYLDDIKTNTQFYRIKVVCGSRRPHPDKFWTVNLTPKKSNLYSWKGDLKPNRIHFKYWKNNLISWFYEQFSRNSSAMAPERLFQKMSNF